MAYYQIGGLKAHTHGWFGHDTKQLSDLVYFSLSNSENVKGKSEAESKGIELVLGMLNTGASYLLVSRDQMDRILRYASHRFPSRLDQPRLASHYASLSPISFFSPAELNAKIKTYAQKPGKKARQRDTSKANTMFDSENPARACFEHQRVLWKAVQPDGTIELTKFALPEMYWLASTSLVALTFIAWNFDSIENRRVNPKILDLGLASVPCMAFRGDYESQVSHSTHLKIEEHSSYGNRGISAAPFKYGTTEIVKKDALGGRLNAFFASIPSDRVFLLVYDADQTCNALKALDVNIGDYKSGIDAFLAPSRESSAQLSRQQRDHKHFARHGDANNVDNHRDARSDSRKRSRSPSRHRNMYSQRTRSPIARQSRLPSPERGISASVDEVEEGEEIEDESPRKTEVYMIDVRALFLALSRLNPSDLKSLPDLAARLGIPVDQMTSCAGNECHLLIEAWKCMASGTSIDEQHVERWLSVQSASLSTNEDAPNPEPEVNNQHADSDEEIDPNDIVVHQIAMLEQPQARLGGFGPPTNDYDSGDSDY
ncbi:hypothetical protein DFH11DRAFT_1143474 [Phellopilus nigrolimitatus]|nr:hypothetical protein DFH11DRAFT_1143474 [Phellopilus nigrolimitatus]